MQSFDDDDQKNKISEQPPPPPPPPDDTVFVAVDESDGIAGLQSGNQSEAIQGRGVEQHLHDEQWAVHLAKDQRVHGDPRPEGAVQKLQPDVRRNPQDAEHVGGEQRAASIGAKGLHIGGGHAGIPLFYPYFTQLKQRPPPHQFRHVLHVSSLYVYSSTPDFLQRCCWVGRSMRRRRRRSI
jgi:hypothetical protein